MSLKEAAAACVGSIVLAVVLIVVDRLGLWGHGRIPYGNGGGCDVWFIRGPHGAMRPAVSQKRGIR